MRDLRQEKGNIEMIQSLLLQNLSIDHIADLMSEQYGSPIYSSKQARIEYWQKRIMDLIKRGVVRA